MVSRRRSMQSTERTLTFRRLREQRLARANTTYVAHRRDFSSNRKSAGVSLLKGIVVWASL